MGGSFSLDRIDHKILAELQAEGRLTNQALAERVALSASACLARVRRLERAGVIQGYHARLDPFMLETGVVLFAEVTLKAHGATDLARFDAAISTLPQIVEASHVSGAFDYLLKVVVADLQEWTRITRQLTSDEVGADRINTHVLLQAQGLPWISGTGRQLERISKGRIRQEPAPALPVNPPPPATA